MQQWWFGNFMQNWSCMHPCGHSSIKFLWSCDTRAQDSFSLFKSTQCFQNMLFYQFMHSSESILGVRENFHSIHPSGAYTFFFKNWCYDQWIFFKEKLEVISFQKRAGLSAKRYIFCSCLFLVLAIFKRLETACNLGTVDTRDYILLKKSVWTKVHQTYTFLCFRQIIVK